MRGLDAHERRHADRLVAVTIDNGMKQRILRACDLRQPGLVALEVRRWLLEQIGPVASLLIERIGREQVMGMAARFECLDAAEAAVHGCAWRSRPAAPVGQRPSGRLRLLLHGLSQAVARPLRCLATQRRAPTTRWQRGGGGTRRRRAECQFLPVLIELKNSPLVLVERSLSTRNSMASIVPIGLRMRRRTYIFLS